MIDISKIDYSMLDRPEILNFLFHPRADVIRNGSKGAAGSGSETDHLIPVAENVNIGARFHMTSSEAPNILFFHGNGEIVADYDDLGVFYNQIGINFLPVDYRGYGFSTGTPTVTAMMQDAHRVFDFVTQWLLSEKFTGPLIVMGRSLGSAPALELACCRSSDMDGLIIESGFARALPLLRLLGIDPDALGLKEGDLFENESKISKFDKPTLIIHAQFDHIIPFSDGQALYDASPAREKTLLNISGANHNDIFARGLSQYLAAIQTLADHLDQGGSDL